MLIEKENWDIRSGNCGHQCMCVHVYSPLRVWGPVREEYDSEWYQGLQDQSPMLLFPREEC